MQSNVFLLGRTINKGGGSGIGSDANSNSSQRTTKSKLKKNKFVQGNNIRFLTFTK